MYNKKYVINVEEGGETRKDQDPNSMQMEMIQLQDDNQWWCKRGSRTPAYV